MARKKINYLSNSEILYEINESKKSFCYSLDDRYLNYDFIIASASELEDSETIELGKEARAKRLNQLLVREAIIAEEDPALVKNHHKAEDMLKEDIVFRVMTYEHVPPAEKVRNTRNESGQYTKVPFPPFKHYAFDDKNNYKEVVRSHWVEGFENGHFNPATGMITNRLAGMFMKLVDRYATKPNWRGYSYIDEMKADALVQLSSFGLKFNESKSNNPFAYYTQVVTNSFRVRLQTEKRTQTIRDDMLVQHGQMPSFNAQIADLETQWQAAHDSIKTKLDAKVNKKGP